jgi:hypothetical protein
MITFVFIVLSVVDLLTSKDRVTNEHLNGNHKEGRFLVLIEGTSVLVFSWRD